jgi:alkaline phosphatase D
MDRDQLNSLVQNSSRLSRRTFLRGGALGTLALAAGLLPNRAAGVAPASLPFSLGIASGDPSHQSVVLWTRLANDPLNGGAMAPVPIEVKWRLATDARMHHVVRRGTVMALPQDAHSVHVEVKGLDPDRWYWYQFESGSEFSSIGRTRTFPAPGSQPRLLRFAFVSCQHFEAGYFNAWQRLAEEDIDFVVHLGDYIYEEETHSISVRQHTPASEITTLDDFRNRHAQYKSDEHLQTAHALFPFIVSWDDHEVEDNYAGAISKNNRDDDPTNNIPQSEFRQRQLRAYQAYFEHMPLPPELQPDGAQATIFRRFDWGRLARFHVLDTRQFRTDQPCAGAKDLLAPAGDDIVIACGEEIDPRASMTGAAQEDWLLDGLRQSKTRWNVIAQQVMMAAVDFGPGVALVDPRLAGLQVRNVDAWDGYVAARNRLLGSVASEGLDNLVVLSGDVHSSWVADLKSDFADPQSPVVGSEFVGTSITSEFPGGFLPIVYGALKDPMNSHIKFFDGVSHGYVRCVVTPEQWRSDYRAVDTVLLPRATIQTLKSFIVNRSHAGVMGIL